MVQSNPTYVLDARAATDHFPGIGRYVSNLTHAMAPQLDRDERLLLLVDSRTPSRWTLPRPDQKRVEWLEAPVSHFSLSQQWQIPRLLRNYDIALFHTPYYLMPYRIKRPIILTCYDMIPLRFPETTAPRARRFYKFFHRLALRQASRVIAISETTQNDLHHFFNLPEEQSAVIPLAADPRFRPPDEPARRALRRRYDLNKPFVLYLGINKPHKNLLRLVQAWQNVRSEAELVIAGAWDSRYPESKREISRLGLEQRVRFLGPIPEDELPALYGTAELFVFPSLYEGFGLPVIEAMACGTAVACSFTSSLPEVGGLAAAYFNPLHLEDITTTIQRLLDLPERRAEAETAGLVQARRFSWEHTAAETLALYRDLVLID